MSMLLDILYGMQVPLPGAIFHLPLPTTVDIPHSETCPILFLPPIMFLYPTVSGLFLIRQELTKVINWAPGGSDGRESACNAGDPGLIPGSGRSPGERSGYPLQYACLGNSMDRGAWQVTIHGVTKSWKTERSTLLLKVTNVMDGEAWHAAIHGVSKSQTGLSD